MRLLIESTQSYAFDFVLGMFIMDWRSSFVPWLFILSCIPCWAQDPSPSPSPDPPHKSHSHDMGSLVLLVLAVLLFMLFIYKYCKNQLEGNKHLKESKISTSFTPGLKKGNQEMWNEVSSGLMEPHNSISVNSEEKHSGYSYSMEFKPPKLEFTDKEQTSPFGVEELLKAPAELLGQEHSGNVYRVMMNHGAVLAVKRLKYLQVEEREFEKRMAFMGSLKHSNVLPVFAYCSSPSENLVIYQYHKKGCLALLLDEFSKGEAELKWNTRLSIIKGIARGLAFMHQEFESQGCIPHGNLKPSNVILSETMEPYIADYGFKSLVEIGTAPTPFHPISYTAPERRITQKSDVYNFGLMLLELLTGKRADHGGLDLTMWVQSTAREEWAVKILDKEMVINVGEDKIVQLLHLSLNCVDRVPEIRPTMSYASDVIDKIWDHEEESNSTYVSPCSSFYSNSPPEDTSMATPSPIRDQSSFHSNSPPGDTSMATPSPIGDQSVMI